MPITLQPELSISDLIQNNLKLASPPNIYFELQNIMKSPVKNMTDAAYIIEKDAALAIKLLKIVNSAFYGFPSKISSIDRAINLIGVTELQNIILSTIVIDKFTDMPNELISMHDFWAKNLRCALIAQEIDLYLGFNYSDTVFICGILHNIGQLVILQQTPNLAREAIHLSQEHEPLTDTKELEIEHKVFGFNHYQVGAALIQHWKLPDVISESIRLHTDPSNTQPYQKIADIIRLADSYSKLENYAENAITNSFEIPANETSILIDKAYDKFDDIFKVFYPS